MGSTALVEHKQNTYTKFKFIQSGRCMYFIPEYINFARVNSAIIIDPKHTNDSVKILANVVRLFRKYLLSVRI